MKKCPVGQNFNKDTMTCSPSINVDCSHPVNDQCIDVRHDCLNLKKEGGCKCFNGECSDWNVFTRNSCPVTCNSCSNTKMQARWLFNSKESSSKEWGWANDDSDSDSDSDSKSEEHSKESNAEETSHEANGESVDGKDEGTGKIPISF